MHAAWRELEPAAPAQGYLIGGALSQADITLAVAWGFAARALKDGLKGADYPAIAAFSARMEKLPAFAQSPVG